MTIKEMIIDYLKNVGSLTVATCLSEIGTVELRKRVSELRREGYPILSRPVKHRNRYGKMIEHNEYYLLGGAF